jgi:hypothetical protein
MNWLLGTFDRLIGTVIAAVTGLAASQTQAFIQAYLQRLGGHLDEARTSYEKLQSGQFLPGADALSQQRMAEAFGHRVDELSQAYSAIADADVFERPFRFIAHMDRAIAEATLTNFNPSLPLDSASLVYSLIGIMLGWLIYELIKLPFAVLGRRHRTA